VVPVVTASVIATSIVIVVIVVVVELDFIVTGRVRMIAIIALVSP
jgi:hypothetical protein